MPGPGGGGSSGGFSRGPGGGGRGGGFSRGSNGGFGGGHHNHGHFGHHHHYRPYGIPFFFGFRRPYYGYGYGGGFFGGFMGLMILPFVIFVLAILLIFNVFGSLGNSISSVARGGEIVYDERDFQDYANQQYEKEFGSSRAYEDNLLIVLLVDEGRSDFTTIAWVGNNIVSEIRDELGGNDDDLFAIAMRNCIGNYYENSLGRDLVDVVDTIREKIESFDLDSSFINPSAPSGVDSHVTNLTDINIQGETLNPALHNFTESTDIPIVILIEDIDEVLDRKINGMDIFIILIAAALIVLAIYLVIKAFKSRKPFGSESHEGDNGYNRSNRSYRDDSTSW